MDLGKDRLAWSSSLFLSWVSG